MIDTPDLPSDVWCEWLLHVRHGDDPAFAEVVRAGVERYADRVLKPGGAFPSPNLSCRMTRFWPLP
jgi:arsenite methyltransferase